MARRPGNAARRPAPPRDPYGLRLSGNLIVPAIAAVGLLFIAWISLSLLSGNLPIKIGKAGPSGQVVGPQKTPTQSSVVVVPTLPPEDKLLGTIVYAKAGNIWVQDAAGARQITTAGDGNSDSMPSFSADGQWVVYVETRPTVVTYDMPNSVLHRNVPTHYNATYPIVFKVHPDGSGRVKITDGLFTSARGSFFYWIRQPVLSPDGNTIAMFSDAPDPTNSDVILQYYNTANGKLTRSTVPESLNLGQQDAAWSPDGQTLLYVKNGRDGPRGAPQIYRLDWKTKKFRAITGPGYNAPQWSPDQKYIVATKTSTLGTDVVILDAKNGSEIARITDDAKSWAGVWSPAGDAIAYLHIDGGVTDLRYVKLSGPAGRWTVSDPIDLTEAAGLDGASHPDWFIPADQLPSPTPTPSTGSPAGSPQGSAPSPSAP